MLASYHPFSIRERQIDALKSMLRLNFSPESDQYWENLWKILIYDDYCKDIVSPLFTVDELRKLGVTLWLSLATPRQSVPDVPVIYFVKPTKENIEKICQDCANKLYTSIYINFSSTLPRELLETLAQKTIESGAAQTVSRIYDQYSGFTSLEDSLFISRQKNSYFNFHNPNISDNDALSYIDDAVDSLFSVMVTLGKVPIIQCPKRGDAAELIAKKLDQKFRDHLSNVSNLFSESSSGFASAGVTFQRPVLIIMDRIIDLSVMLSHAWSYQALVHDLLNMGLNRVTVDVKDNKDGTSKTEVYDLDPKDNIWCKNAGESITQVAVSIKQEVEEYEKKIGKRKSADGISVIEDNDEEPGISRNIHEKINLIPELTKKKEKLDMHTKIAWNLLNMIKKRNLDEFVKLEGEIVTRSSVSQQKKEVLAAIESDKGTTEDKLRLFLIFYVAHQNLPQSELAEFESKLSALGCDLAPLHYLKTIKAFDDNWATQSSQPTSTSTSSTSSSAPFLSKEFLSMFGSFVSAGMQYFVPQSKDYYVTRVVDAITELKYDKLGIADYLYLDPKFQPNSAPRKNSPFREAVVFMVGGGNYVEYQNLKDYANKASTNTTEVNPLSIGKKIIYGTTEMLNGTQFMNQLAQLGNIYNTKTSNGGSK